MVISDLQYKLIFSGMVVGVPDSALRGLGPDLGQNRWAVFFGKTLCYHSASLCCRVGTNDCQSCQIVKVVPPALVPIDSFALARWC